jgi:chromosome segregation ATPase
MPSTANTSIMRQNEELASKVADLQTALVQHKPVPQQQLALPSNVNASPTPQENELKSKVSLLEAALQKAEQEVSSAKTELLEMKANLDKVSKQGANAPDFGNLDVTVRAKVLVDRK